MTQTNGFVHLELNLSELKGSRDRNEFEHLVVRRGRLKSVVLLRFAPQIRPSSIRREVEKDDCPDVFVQDTFLPINLDGDELIDHGNLFEHRFDAVDEIPKLVADAGGTKSRDFVSQVVKRECNISVDPDAKVVVEDEGTRFSDGISLWIEVKG